MQESTFALYSITKSVILLRQALTSLESANSNQPSKENEDLVANVQKDLQDALAYINTLALSRGINLKDDDNKMNYTKLMGIIELEDPLIINISNWRDKFL